MLRSNRPPLDGDWRVHDLFTVEYRQQARGCDMYLLATIEDSIYHRVGERLAPVNDALFVNTAVPLGYLEGFQLAPSP